MPYIQRNHHGEIYAVAQTQDDVHQEYIKPTDSELVAFLTSQAAALPTKHTLAESDADIARVTEDLVQLLINKNSILFTELPPAVQQKLLNRKKLRSHLNQGDSNFLDDSESI
ncbi:MAG: hypothetical protein KTR20_04165 [Cellvibrionaceae bacterium]|nr:hypothetical protein [Cellvibrionaceae bacterium]